MTWKKVSVAEVRARLAGSPVPTTHAGQRSCSLPVGAQGSLQRALLGRGPRQGGLGAAIFASGQGAGSCPRRLPVWVLSLCLHKRHVPPPLAD